MDRCDKILEKYAAGKRCIVVCPNSSTRSDMAALLDSTANTRNLTKTKGINTHANKTERAQTSKLEDRRLTVWNIEFMRKDQYLNTICQHKYDYLFVYDLKEKDLNYILSTVGRYCINHVIDCENVADDDSSIGSDLSNITSLLDDLTLDSNSITSSEFMREKYLILDQNYKKNESVRRKTVLTKSPLNPVVSKDNSHTDKIKSKKIHVEQCTVVNVPRLVTKYMKLYSSGSTVIVLTHLSSYTVQNTEHKYYTDVISRLNKGTVCTFKKTDPPSNKDCILICHDSNIKFSRQYKQLIYIVDDPGRCRSYYSKKLSDDLSNTVQKILSLNVEQIVIVCNEYYSGYYTISNNVQIHPVHQLVQKYSSNILTTDEVHSKYPVPYLFSAADYIKSTNIRYNSTEFKPKINKVTDLNTLVEHLVCTYECPYDEDTALNRWYSMDTDISYTYYSPTGILVDFHLNYKSSAGYLYCTSLDDLLVSMLHYGLKSNAIFIDMRSTTVKCYMISL